MAKYTTELGTICESLAGNIPFVGASNVNQVIQDSYQKIFDFSYPQIPAVNYDQLEQDIILHFYTREIGFETYGLWKLRLMQWMREKMQYYNMLYETVLMKYNPIGNVLYTETMENENKGNRNNNNVKNYQKGTTDTTTGSGSDTVQNSGANTDSWSGTVRVANSGTDTVKRSDTPQGGLTGLRNDEYLTEASMTDLGTSETTTRGDSVRHEMGAQVKTTLGSSHTTKHTGSDSDSELLKMNELFTSEQIKKMEGKIGGESFSKLLMEYREAIINVNEMLFDGMECLFMGIW